MAIEGSAIAAMNVLRAQIEERLSHTEDYRALRALDRAIADVQFNFSARAANPSATIHPSSGPVPTNPVADQHELLQQKISERFEPAAA